MRPLSALFHRVLPIVSLALAISACTFDMGAQKPPAQENVDALSDTPTGAILKRVRSSMASRGFAEDESNPILLAGQAKAATVAGDASADYAAIIPAAIEGSMAKIGETDSMAQDRKEAFTDALIAGFVASMNGLYEATGSRALDASTVTYLLEKLSKAAISNLAKAGIAPERRATVAGSVVGTIVGSLDEGGVDRTLVNGALGMIAKAAVEALGDAGFSGIDAKKVAVKAIAQGAVQGMANAAIPGITSADMPAMIKEISSGAATSLGGVCANIGEVKALVAEVAAGTGAGIVEIKKNDATLESTVVTAMITEASAGTTAGIMKSDHVDQSVDAAALITEISKASSKELAIGIATLALDGTQLAACVATGASAAAQTAVTGGMSAAALKEAIVISDAGGSVVTGNLDQAIASGVTLGNNTLPVIACGLTDRTAETGTKVDIDASQSSDMEDASTALAFSWSLVRPAGSSAVISASSGSAISITPDIAGTFIVTLKVKDSAGGESIANITIRSMAAQGDPIYAGKTLNERLVAVSTLLNAQDYPAARDECLLILGHYPDSNAFAEVYFRLGKAYWGIGYREIALSQYDAAARYPGTPYAYKAMVERSFRRMGSQIDISEAEFKKVVAEVPNTLEAATALIDLGQVEDKRKNWVACKTYMEQADNHAQAVLWIRQMARRYVAMCIGMETEDPVQAGIEANKLLTEGRYLNITPDDPSTFSPGDYFSSVLSLASVYRDNGFLDKAIELLTTLKNDARMAEANRLLASRYIAEIHLWRKDGSLDNLNAALAEITDGLSRFNPGTAIWQSRIKSETLVRKGQIHEDLVWKLIQTSDRDQAYAKAIECYDQAIAMTAGKWYDVTMRAYANSAKAGIACHYKRDFSMAEAAALAVIDSYPAEMSNQDPKAQALLRLAQVYMQKGYKAKDTATVDHVPYFERAIGLFDRCAPAYFQNMKSAGWPFTEAARNRAECLAALGRYTAGKTAFKALLENSAFSAVDRAWIRKDYCDLLGEEILDAVSKGDDVTNLAVTARAERLPIDDIKNADGSLVDSGKPSADLWAQAAWYERETGRVIHQDRGRFDDAVPYYEAAIAAGSRLNDAQKYVAVGPGYWATYNAKRRVGQALVYLKRYDEAMPILESLIADVNAGVYSASYAPTLNKDLGWVYKRKASDSVITNSTEWNVAEVLYDQAIAKYRAVVTEQALQQDPGTCGWALADLGWTVNQMISRYMWKDWSDDKPAFSDMKPKAAAMLQIVLDEYARLKDMKSGGELLDSGKCAASLLASTNWSALEYAKFLRENGAVEDAFAAVNAALARAEDIANYPEAYSWDAMETAYFKMEAHFGLCEALYGTPNSGFAEHFIVAEDLAYATLASPHLEAAQAARVSLTLGRAYAMLGPKMIGNHPKITNDAAWKALAKLLLENAVGYGNAAEQWVIDDANEWLGKLPPDPAPTPSPRLAAMRLRQVRSQPSISVYRERGERYLF